MFENKLEFMFHTLNTLQPTNYIKKNLNCIILIIVHMKNNLI